MKFLLVRTIASVLQLFLVSVATFALFRLLPGDLYTAALQDPQISQSTVEAMRRAGGEDQAWTRRYLQWAKSGLRGDFGVSLAYGVPVGSLLAPRMRSTLAIAIPALVLGWAAGLLSALLAVRFRFDGAMASGASAAAMTPDVITISLLLWAAVWAGMPITGAWLPILGLGCTIVPVVFLHASAELTAARELEFVRIAQSRGVAGSRLWFRYVLPAAANPLVSLAGLSIATVIGASFIVEVLTGWPGLGPLFLEAVQARDYPIVQTIVVLLAGILTLSNLVADLLLFRLDPRIRMPHER